VFSNAQSLKKKNRLHSQTSMNFVINLKFVTPRPKIYLHACYAAFDINAFILCEVNISIYLHRKSAKHKNPFQNMRKIKKKNDDNPIQPNISQL
jgi:hypothetical protein